MKKKTKCEDTKCHLFRAKEQSGCWQYADIYDCSKHDRVKELEQRLEEAEKVIGFYANPHASWGGSHGGCVIPQDRSIVENTFQAGGKRAREYMNKYASTAFSS